MLRAEVRAAGAAQHCTGVASQQPAALNACLLGAESEPVCTSGVMHPLHRCPPAAQHGWSVPPPTPPPPPIPLPVCASVGAAPRRYDPDPDNGFHEQERCKVTFLENRECQLLALPLLMWCAASVHLVTCRLGCCCTPPPPAALPSAPSACTPLACCCTADLLYDLALDDELAWRREGEAWEEPSAEEGEGDGQGTEGAVYTLGEIAAAIETSER